MLKHKLDVIKAKLLNGELSYDEAKKEAMPLISQMNRKSKEIAKKHNVKARNFTFAGLMR